MSLRFGPPFHVATRRARFRTVPNLRQMPPEANEAIPPRRLDRSKLLGGRGYRGKLIVTFAILGGVAPFLGVALKAKPEPEIKPRLVRTEAIRIIPLEQRTFNDRWSALPVPIHMVKVASKEEVLPLPPDSPHITAKRKSRSISRVANLCERHGLRKVHYGKRWRCRR